MLFRPNALKQRHKPLLFVLSLFSTVFVVHIIIIGVLCSQMHPVLQQLVLSLKTHEALHISFVTCKPAEVAPHVPAPVAQPVKLSGSTPATMVVKKRPKITPQKKEQKKGTSAQAPKKPEPKKVQQPPKPVPKKEPEKKHIPPAKKELSVVPEPAVLPATPPASAVYEQHTQALLQEIHDDILKQWKRPAGTAHTECHVRVSIDSQGKKTVAIVQPSQALALDLSARHFMQQYVFPRQLWNKEIVLIF